MKIFKIITLMPDFFEGPLKTGLMGRAISRGIVDFKIINLRDYGIGNYKQCDDYPYGGGSGMVLMPEPLFKAILQNKGNSIVVFPTPSGKPLSQDDVKKLAGFNEFLFICGQYEGIDQRVIDRFVDYEYSIGDFILSAGEYATIAMIDAIMRYEPGFMNNPGSLKQESFENYLLEYPQYTRPYEIDGMKVPEILLSGNHEKIKQWRLEESIEKTRAVRPDLYKKYIKVIDEVKK